MASAEIIAMEGKARSLLAMWLTMLTITRLLWTVLTALMLLPLTLMLWTLALVIILLMWHRTSLIIARSSHC